MRINADLVLRLGSDARLHSDGRITVAAWSLMPGSRVYLRNSREIVRVTGSVEGQRQAVRERDGHPCLLASGELYEAVTEVLE